MDRMTLPVAKKDTAGTSILRFVRRRPRYKITSIAICISLFLYVLQGNVMISLLLSQSSSTEKALISFDPVSFNKNSLPTCLISNPRIKSAAHLWKSKISAILDASRHPDDPLYSHLDWTKYLLAHLSPSTLSKSLKSHPSPKSMARIMSKIRHKMEFPNSAPPLKIAVLGGSMTEGKGCEFASVKIPKGSIMSNPTYCAWPYRFESFVNSFLGVKAVEVINMAEEGTETALMTPLLRNWLYPSSLLPSGPDIVVNAYTNSDYDTSHSSSTLKLTVLEEMEAFMEAVESSHPCGEAPLVINMDDSLLYNDIIGKNNIMTVDYSDAISKVKQIDKTRVIPKDESDVSFGMAGHIAIAWVLSFTLCDAIIKYCHDTQKRLMLVVPDKISQNNIITERCRDASTGDSPCTFAWFAGPKGTLSRASEITRYIQPFVTLNTGWKANTEMSTGWSRKAGLDANTLGATIVFQFDDIQKEINYVNLMTLRTNLPKWQGSRALVTIIIQEHAGDESAAREIAFEIDASHASDTHITYPVEVALKDYKAVIGSDVSLRVELIQGDSFKIIGMMLCA